MSWFKGFELLDRPSSSLFYRESAVCFPRTSSIFADDHLAFALDILNPSPPSAFDLLAFLDEPLVSSSAAAFRRLEERAETELYLQSLTDRVAALELGFNRALRSQVPGRDRTYTWTAEIKGGKADGFDRKYKLTAEAKTGEARNIKWTAEVKGKGKDAPASRTYTFQASSAPAAKADKEKKKSGSTARAVEIEDEQPNPVVIRKTFAKKFSKGKGRELSPQDAAVIIQVCFRAYMVRRSQVLRSLRNLAVAKAKLKEIRALFSNFSYRGRIAKDAEERQRFSEKIIVLLLTVDAIEGPDYMVRAAKKSILEELEAMLEVVDPQPLGRLGSLKRRKFDLPGGELISNEMLMGVADVVQLLDQEDNRSA